MTFRLWDEHDAIEVRMPRQIAEYLLERVSMEGVTGLCGDSEWQHLFVGANKLLSDACGVERPRYGWGDGIEAEVKFKEKV
jgi:hypothetical protein